MFGIWFYYQYNIFEESNRSSLDIKLGSYRWLWLVSRKQCGTINAIDLPPLLPNSKTEVICEVIPTNRGIMRLIGMTVVRPDPFGLFCDLSD